ncbi:MAG: hypothetical protein AAF624_18585, partial [Bacteroidota bacterium]
SPPASSGRLWRQFRREVTHCELFESVKALVEAGLSFFRRSNATPERVLSVIGARSASGTQQYLRDCT